MSARCEPPEELRGVDGWHWFTEHNPVLWIADRQEWEWGQDDWVTPEAAYRYGYRYLAPVSTPAEVAALQQTFDLRWQADMRAIKRWQAANPGNDLTFPDRADMVVWLLEQDDKLRTERDKYQRRSEVAERAFWRLLHNHTTLRAEVERLRGAVRSIANQKLQTEMQEDEYPIADFHGAYGAIVEVARAALIPKEPGNEG